MVLGLALAPPSWGCKSAPEPESKEGEPGSAFGKVGTPGPDEAHHPAPPKIHEPVREAEPNDTPKSAMPVEAAVPVDAVVSGAKDVDWFRVTPEGTRTLRAEVTGADGTNLELALLDAAGRRVTRSIDNTGPGEGETITNVQIDGPALLRVRPRKKSVAGAAYRLVVTLSKPDDRAEAEPNGSPSKATPLVAGTEREGFLNNGEDRDVFEIKAAADPALALEAEVEGVRDVDAEVRLYRSKREVASTVPLPAGERVRIRGLAPPTPESPLFLEIRARKGFNVTDRYRVGVRASSGDATEDLEPNDGTGIAAALHVDSAARGTIGWPGDEDIFAIDGLGEGIARVELDGVPGLTLAVAVLGADGKPIQEARASEPGGKALLPNAPLPEGARFLRVEAGKGESNADVPYSVLVSLRDGAGEEREPNDTREQATGSPLDVGFARRGFVSHSADLDFYRLDLRALETGRILTMRLRAPEGVRLTAEISSDAGEALTSIGSVPAGEERTVTHFFNPGVYVVAVSSPDRSFSTGAPYSLSVVP